MDCKEAKNILISDFLQNRGILPSIMKSNVYWYKSPFREEKLASFKVDISKNIWFDHGLGVGGDLLKLVCLLFRVEIKQALEILSNGNFPAIIEAKKIRNENLKIIENRSISNRYLCNYLLSRKVNREIALQYCREVYFKVNEKNYFAIGFQNNSGGWELRNKYYKGSSSPKDITLIKLGKEKICVFEGFFDFISALSCEIFDVQASDFLVLNSLSFLVKSKEIVTDYPEVFLFFDNDNAGKKATNEIKKNREKGCHDCSVLYKDHKDVNEFLMSIPLKGSKW